VLIQVKMADRIYGLADCADIGRWSASRQNRPLHDETA
jgi:hypothetical protein